MVIVVVAVATTIYIVGLGTLNQGFVVGVQQNMKGWKFFRFLDLCQHSFIVHVHILVYVPTYLLLSLLSNAKPTAIFRFAVGPCCFPSLLATQCNAVEC